jgi:hypothetical protein
MSTRLSWLFALSFVSLLSSSSQAVLRPLTDAERFENSSDIVTGYVTSVKKAVRKTDIEFSDTHYTVQMIVSTIEKGKSVFGGETLKFHFWKELDRPRNWCGDSGQSGVIKYYQIIRAHLKFDERSNNFQLLNPNGFDLIQR